MRPLLILYSVYYKSVNNKYSKYAHKILVFIIYICSIKEDYIYEQTNQPSLLLQYFDYQSRGNIMNACKVPGCPDKVRANGHCNKHDLQMKRNGRILTRTKFDPNKYIKEVL
jgi:hypothetical protein